jgi:hypothetical protein
MKRAKGLVVASIVAFLMCISPAAHATDVGVFGVVCNSTLSWSFSPPLAINFVSGGTVDQTYSNGVCVDAGADAWAIQAWPLPVSESIAVSHNPFTFSTVNSYIGDCQVAFVDVGFWPDTTAALIGGSVLISEPKTFGAGNEFGEVYVFAPLLLPCSETSAIGAGPAYGAGAGLS